MIVEARKESCSDVDSAFIYIYLTLLNSAYCSLYYRRTHRLTSILRNPCFYYKFVHVTFCNGFTATNMASVLLLKKKKKGSWRQDFSQKKKLRELNPAYL